MRLVGLVFHSQNDTDYFKGPEEPLVVGKPRTPNELRRDDKRAGFSVFTMQCGAWLEKPEPLRNNLAGCWSRRIDREHCLAYQGDEDRYSERLLPI